jgi:hypothetical protein
MLPTTSDRPLGVQAAAAIGTTASARPAAISPSSGRQRGEGRRPVGNSRSVRGNEATKPGAKIQTESQAKRGPSGHEPVAVSRAYLEYSQEKPLRLLHRPPERRTHPTGFRGAGLRSRRRPAEKETARITDPVVSDEPIPPR